MSRVGLFPSKNMSSFSSCGICVIALRFSNAGAASVESLAEMNNQQARGPRSEDSIYWEGTRKQEQAKNGRKGC
ncbi:2-oxoglutarate-dependent dioxygenase mpl2 [Fusarium oxysporum f. sp. albedinis]|nr:2-oxoglutarate-dependent dioxygenase mpl2 [Fusarium oxysporum f. sp. albedinis]